MIRNVGDIDRRVRIVIGVVIMMTGAIEGDFFGIIGALPLASGLYAYCPIYKILKINSLDQNKTNDKNKK